MTSIIRIIAMERQEPLTFIQWKFLRWMAEPYGHPPYDASSCQSFLLDRGHPYLGENMTLDARRAATTCIARGWVWVDAYGNHRLNDAGRAAAATIPEPAWSPPPPPRLRDRDFEVLGALESANRTSRYPRAWAASLDCGGMNGSYHSASLKKLARHGYAECRQRGSRDSTSAAAVISRPSLWKRGKGSLEYRITDAGVAAYETWAGARRAARAT